MPVTLTQNCRSGRSCNIRTPRAAGLQLSSPSDEWEITRKVHKLCIKRFLLLESPDLPVFRPLWWVASVLNSDEIARAIVSDGEITPSVAAAARGRPNALRWHTTQNRLLRLYNVHGPGATHRRTEDLGSMCAAYASQLQGMSNTSRTPFTQQHTCTPSCTTRGAAAGPPTFRCFV